MHDKNKNYKSVKIKKAKSTIKYIITKEIYMKSPITKGIEFLVQYT